MLWLLLATLANAGTLRVQVEVGPEGAVLRDAVVVEGDRGRLGVAPGGHGHGNGIDGAGPALEVVDAAGEVLATTALPDVRQRTVIYPEGGGDGVILDRALARLELPWPDGAERVRLAGQLDADPTRSRSGLELRPRTPLPRPPPSAIPLQESGPASDRLDMVFLGDGYTSGQLDDFADDVDRIVDYLLTIEPWGAYTGLFNIWRVDVASNDSGVTHLEGSGVSRDTAFGCYYGCGGLDRLVCCDDDLVLQAVEDALPGADGIMVLINDPMYGGSGGFTYATSYVGAIDGHQVAAHELGHTLVGLWDEYGYGYDGFGTGPNCAASEDGRWDAWLGTDGVGAWQECSYNSLYRPTENGCMMRTLRDDYCPICREQAVLAMYGRLPGLIASVDPPEGSDLDAVEQDVIIVPEVNGPDDGLVFEWTVDGEVVGTEPELDLRCSGVNGEVTLTVYDDTRWVRQDPQALLVDVAGPWQVRSEECLRLDRVAQACEGCHTAPGPAGLGPLLGLSLLLWRRRVTAGRSRSGGTRSGGVRSGGTRSGGSRSGGSRSGGVRSRR